MHKVWLWIFAAMFLVPEILWKPVGNLFYEFIQPGGNVKLFRNNLLVNGDHNTLYSVILGIELISICSFLYLVIRNKNKLETLYFYVFLVLSLFLSLITLFSFYFVTFVHISFP